MRKQRFPKLSYVRQLERLYDELADWRDAYDRDSRLGQPKRPHWRFAARAQDVAQVQQDLVVAINHLYGLTSLS